MVPETDPEALHVRQHLQGAVTPAVAVGSSLLMAAAAAQADPGHARVHLTQGDPAAAEGGATLLSGCCKWLKWSGVHAQWLGRRRHMRTRFIQAFAGH